MSKRMKRLLAAQATLSLLVIGLLGVLNSAAADPSLIGWWKFDETSGTTAADSSGNGHNGTLNGNATWAAGQLAGALQLDGSGDYVNCGLLNIDTALTGGMTVCAWINKVAGGDMKFVSNFQVANNPGGGFQCAVYNNRMEMDFSNATQRVLSRDAGGPTVPANTWVHLAWVYDDVADTFNEYHNGVLADTDTVTVSVGVSTRELLIGSRSPTLGLYVNGLMDDVRIYTRALTQEEIVLIMNPGVLVPPEAPTSLTAQAVAGGKVLLNWTDNSNNEDGFKIERRDGASSFTEIAQVSANANSYLDTGLTIEETYTYRVFAFNAAGNSTYSNEVSLTIPLVLDSKSWRLYQ